MWAWLNGAGELGTQVALRRRKEWNRIEARCRKEGEKRGVRRKRECSEGTVFWGAVFWGGCVLRREEEKGDEKGLLICMLSRPRMEWKTLVEAKTLGEWRLLLLVEYNEECHVHPSDVPCTSAGITCTCQWEWWNICDGGGGCGCCYWLCGLLFYA